MSGRLWFMRAVQPVVGRFPTGFYRVADVAAWILFRLRPGLRRKLLSNMEPFAPGEPATVRRFAEGCLRNVCRYYVDLCSVPYLDMRRFELDHLRITGGERLTALQNPGAIVAVSAHLGNAELVIQALTPRGRPFVALVEPLRPPSWSRYLRRLRSSAGGTFHDANFQGIRSSLETLQNGGLVGFMGDRDLQGNGLCTKLAGRAVRLPRGPWEIARRTDALVLPVFTAREAGGHFVVYVEEPFKVARTVDEDCDVKQAVERFAALLGGHLARDPSQWAVTESYWLAHGCG